MSNGIIYDIPKDGVYEDDNIMIEVTEDCDIDTANEIFKLFQNLYPKATVSLLHPTLIKSIRFFHKQSTLPF